MAAPRFVLRIVKGPGANSTFPVGDGVTVVGRAADCDISLQDQSLSRRHFEMRVGSEGCRVIDLGSRNRLVVNGSIADEAVVGAGDEIRAGEVVLRIEPRYPDAAPIFEQVEPTLSAAAAPPEPGTLLAALAASISKEAGSRLYAIVDGAQAFELAFAGRLMGHRLYTLFSGDLAQVTAQVGPCLVEIGEPSAFLRKWTDGIGQHAGILFESAADFDALAAHLRGIFIATDEEGQEYFFRFYDPRVLRVFLPTCHADELREFFGPVARWIAEDEQGTSFDTFVLHGSTFETGRIGS